MSVTDHNMPNKQKSHLPPSPTLAPWLVFQSRDKEDHTLFNVSDPNKNNNNNSSSSLLKSGGNMCLASSMNGWLVMMDLPTYRKKANFFLWNPETQYRIVLPSWNPRDFSCNHCILKSTPTDPYCMVLCIGDEFVLFWRKGDKKWTKQGYKIGDLPYYKIGDQESGDFIPKLMTSSNITIYSTTFESNLFIIERRRCGTLSIRLLDVEKPKSDPSVTSSQYYIVESCGELFYVLIHCFKYTVEISRVEVFKLNFLRKVWVKVDGIRDTVFFLSPHTASMSLSVTNSGLKGNQIYFILRNDDKNLYVYDLEDESLSLYLPCPSIQGLRSLPPYWLMHNSRLAGRHKEDTKKAPYEELKMVESRNMVATIQENVELNRPDWTDLPRDLLRLSTTHITFGNDYKKFRSVCKTWAASVPQYRWPMKQVGLTYQCPWLMFSNREEIKCNFVDPKSSHTHCVDMPEIMGTKICVSKDGWLLLSKGDRSIFFFNPFNNIIIKLPDLPVPFRFNCISFSSLPTSPDCIVFCVRSESYEEVNICYLHITTKTWVQRCFTNDFDMILLHSNPVFCDGAFYCIDYQGHLGVFDIKDGRCDWTHLAAPEPPPITSHVRNYLVECNGGMLSVYVNSYLGKRVTVYKLNRSNMSWVLSDSLEDHALFLSQAMSISLKGVDEGMKNKIYFPISYNNDKNNYVFYSMETRRWHSSFGDFCSEDIYTTSEQLHCTWIQPILSWNLEE